MNADPLARRSGESAAANRALNDYALMGCKRSLNKLIDRYKKQTKHRPKTHQKTPTLKISTIKDWSRKNQWVERVEQYDELERQRLNEEAHEARLDLVSTLMVKAKIQAQQRDLSKMGDYQFIQATHTILQNSRLEHSEPTERHAHTGADGISPVKIDHDVKMTSQFDVAWFQAHKEACELLNRLGETTQDHEIHAADHDAQASGVPENGTNP